MKLLEEVCDLMPQSYKDQCEDFVTKYGSEIVEFLLSSAAPHTICSLLHLCFFKDQLRPGQSHLHHLHSWRMKLIQYLHCRALLTSQKSSSPPTVSPAAHWPCWAEFTWDATPLNLRLPCFSSQCVLLTPRPFLRFGPQSTSQSKPLSKHSFPIPELNHSFSASLKILHY